MKSKQNNKIKEQTVNKKNKDKMAHFNKKIKTINGMKKNKGKKTL